MHRFVTEAGAFLLRHIAYLRAKPPMNLTLYTYELPLTHSFRISRETTDVQQTLIAALELDGVTGYGEATANEYYHSSIAGMQAEILGLEQQIRDFPFEEPEAFHRFLTEQGLGNFALCALDLAAHDLYGKRKGKPLYELWGTSNGTYPITNYTIGIDTVARMREKMLEKPWPIYKIKLGTDRDVSIVRELRRHTNAVFRIDANGAWTAEETLRNAPQLKELGVEFIEQPLPADDWEGMKKVFHGSVLPVIADESCVTESDVARCAHYFHGINIKLCKCGGLTPARRMIGHARELGLQVMVGCMTESSVGISAIAQLLPLLDYVDMDGAMLLAQDIAEGVVIQEGGRIRFPQTGGSGIELIK